MMKMNVMSRVHEHYEFTCNRWGEENVFFTYLYGSQNYGMDTENSDVDTKSVLLTDYTDLLFGRRVSVEHHLDNGEHCEVKDFVSFSECLFKQNLNFVEAFGSRYVVVNPRYQDLFKAFYEQFKDVTLYNVKKGMFSSLKQAENHYEHFKKYHDYKRLCSAYTLACYGLSLYELKTGVDLVYLQDEHKQKFVDAKRNKECANGDELARLVKMKLDSLEAKANALDEKDPRFAVKVKMRASCEKFVANVLVNTPH